MIDPTNIRVSDGAKAAAKKGERDGYRKVSRLPSALASAKPMMAARLVGEPILAGQRQTTTMSIALGAEICCGGD